MLRKSITYLAAYLPIILVFIIMLTAFQALSEPRGPVDPHDGFPSDIARFLGESTVTATTRDHRTRAEDLGFYCRILYLNAFICTHPKHDGELTLLPDKGNRSIIIIDCQLLGVCTLETLTVIRIFMRFFQIADADVEKPFSIPPLSVIDRKRAFRITYFNYAARIYPARPD